MTCKFLLPIFTHEISYCVDGQSIEPELKVLSIIGCTANSNDDCPKEKIKGKITAHCWRFK